MGGMIRDALNSGSKWARLAAEIVLDKIQGDLSSENQELKAKTLKLLATDPVLKKMIFDGPEMNKLDEDQ